MYVLTEEMYARYVYTVVFLKKTQLSRWQVRYSGFSLALPVINPFNTQTPPRVAGGGRIRPSTADRRRPSLPFLLPLRSLDGWSSSAPAVLLRRYRGRRRERLRASGASPSRYGTHPYPLPPIPKLGTATDPPEEWRTRHGSYLASTPREVPSTPTPRLPGRRRGRFFSSFFFFNYFSLL